MCQPPSAKASSACNSEEDCGGQRDRTTYCACCGIYIGSCSDSVGNRNDVPNACRATCEWPTCGDGVVDPGNGGECDDGAGNGNDRPCLGPHSRCVAGSKDGVTCTMQSDCPDGTCTTVQGCLSARCGDGLVCSDPNCFTGPADLSAFLAGGSLRIGPEQCDDGNTNNTDGCTNAGYVFTVGASTVLGQCARPVCGDAVTSGTEECDAGVAVCVTGVRQGRPCTTNDDCTVASIIGMCSGGGTGVTATQFGPYGTDNRDDLPNSRCITTGVACQPFDPTACGGNPAECIAVCRSTCSLGTCGDGVSDTGEECDDGSAHAGPGDYCFAVRRCVGGENPHALCTSPADCTKGICGSLNCVQNTCGDGVVATNEECDDGGPADRVYTR